MTVLEHEKAFLQAWKDPAATRYELTPLDVNKVLADRYVLGEPLVFTRAMLWDMEARKARHPDVFIPYVVAAGSAAAWGDEDIFVRKCDDRPADLPRRALRGRHRNAALEPLAHRPPYDRTGRPARRGVCPHRRQPVAP